MMINFYKEADLFLKKVFKRLLPYQSELSHLSIDHICYRTCSITEYEAQKIRFGELGELLIESMIGGRPIATFRLHQPLLFDGYHIDLVEVPAPKSSKPTPSGLEHLEFVIAHNFDWVKKIFGAESISDKGSSKTLNPEIEVTFEDFAIKFHHMSLQEVIAIEKSVAINKALKNHHILERLAPYHPLISGTIPLRIDINGSDLDILCQAQDLERFELDCRQYFSKIEGFKISRSLHQGLDTLTICFLDGELKVELFCQNRIVFHQNANLHFLSEARLLKVLGPLFKEKVIELKRQGRKTEPAFGELLNLSHPYEDLIALLSLSERELRERFISYSSNS